MAALPAGALAVLIVTPSVIAAGTTPVPVELYAFTNSEGASFNGQVLSVSGDKVSIKREDGQTFLLKISALGKDDQTYIQK